MKELRLARAADIPDLRELIDVSVRGLQREDYSAAQIDAALRTVYGVDSQLILDETYFAVTVAGGPKPIACGGWSKRRTLFGGDQAAGRQAGLLDPAVDAAKIRAFFVHPDFVRQGIGSQILSACEKAAMEAGFRRFEMGATLTGVRLYEARGYAAVERIEVPLGPGLSLPVIRMVKDAAG